MENILEHEDVQDIRKSARATARQMATKEAAAKKGALPRSKTAAPTVVAVKKTVEHAAIPRRHPLGHRHGTRAFALQRVQVGQRREQVLPVERRMSESCGSARGDEGMGAQDKVVLSAGAGVCSADCVTMAYNSKLRCHAHMIGRQGKFVASWNVFFEGQLPQLLFALTAAPKAKIAYLRFLKCFDTDETVAAELQWREDVITTC